MTNSYRLEDVAADNESSLKTLVRTIALSQGQFRLILARCNYGTLRDRIVQQLRELSPVKIRELVLPKSVKSLYTTIKAELSDEVQQALMVFGVESTSHLKDVLKSSNYIREEFSQHFPFPLVLWINDEVLRKLLRLAPDLESWATSVEFKLATHELLDFLRQKTDKIFANVSTPYLENSLEIESAWNDLQRREQGLEPDLQASLEFVRGLDDFANERIDAALEHYQKSLAFWQQRNNGRGVKLYAPISGLERQGILLLNIALCYCCKAEQNRAESRRYWEQARDYLQQCLDAFEQEQRLDLVAQHISKLGEVLRRLQAWEQLQALAEKALRLHQNYGNPSQLAQDYGFLAEVALNQSRWRKANKLAQKALLTLSTIPDVQPHEQGLYRFILACSQEHLGKFEEAISNLEKARQESNPQYDPQLPINILGKLRELYFQQGKYVDAFEIKKEKRLIEYQYNFQAFAGVFILEPKRQIINPTLTQTRQPASVAREIAASGREHFVKRLIERISDNYYKLTVIHGQSGVGKSSIIQAGLVPALRQQAIGERDAFPVVLRVYTDWVETLGRRLAEVFEDVRGKSLPAPVDSTEAIIEQLRKNADRNLLTVLIFDQFEEFFFVCKDPAKRRHFYEFLSVCLDIPFVKVILSLREDYLHYLLECNRLNHLTVINHNILDKDILCYLGNFSRDEAKLVIESLTNRSQFYLEPLLIDELVKDLAVEWDLVRPIELQIVGAQLQAENITTLEQYQRLGDNPKAELVKRYLAEIIKDCGSEENRKVAQLVLYLLTDENNTRPLKTKNELKNDLAAEADKLHLVLDIFVESGLVLHFPGDSYQLVHDYLADLIRQQQGDELRIKLKEWKELKERGKLDKARLNLLRIVLAGSGVVAFLLAISTASALRFWLEAKNNEATALSKSSEALYTSPKRDLLDPRLEALRAGKPLKRAVWAQADTRTLAASVLQQAIAVFRFTERNRLENHQGEVRSVAFSPDGEIIATASFDKTVQLWSREGKEPQTLKEHNDEVRSVAFSPDGKRLATASKDGTVILWSKDGEKLYTYIHNQELWSVSFSPDGKRLATATDKGYFAIISLDGKKRFVLYQGHKDAAVLSVSFSPDGQTIATASDDKTVKLWSKDGKLLRTLKGHDGKVFSVSFSPKDQTIATASNDKTVKLWSKNGQYLRTLKGHDEGVTSVSFSPDGKMIATTSVDNTVKLWSLDAKELQTLRGHTSWVWSASFSPDSQSLATASTDRSVKLWSRDGKEPQTLAGHNDKDKVLSVSFSPDNKTIATASFFDKTVKLWSRDGKLLRTLKGHKDAVTQVSFSPDGQTLATASFDKTVKLWSRDGKLLRTLAGYNGHKGAVWSVSFSPDGKTIATASFDKTVKLWSKNGQYLKTLNGHDEAVRSVSFSPDSQTIATASRDKTVKLWSRDGIELYILEGHYGAVNSVSFSPDGKMIATASADNTVILWSWNGKEPKTLKGHENWVYGVSFSPDSKTIATASGDKTVKLWNTDGEEIQTLTGHDDEVISVSFSPDGQTLASSGFAGRVILWNLKDVGNLDKLLERSCDWVRDYLNNNGNAQSERYLCDGIGTQKSQCKQKSP